MIKCCFIGPQGQRLCDIYYERPFQLKVFIEAHVFMTVVGILLVSFIRYSFAFNDTLKLVVYISVELKTIQMTKYIPKLKLK